MAVYVYTASGSSTPARVRGTITADSPRKAREQLISGCVSFMDFVF